jgi:hypothetical protein
MNVKPLVDRLKVQRYSGEEITVDGVAYLIVKEDDVLASEYALLYKYLRDRFSDRLVLTFGQIEDLLGFSLPGPARVHREWWGDTDQDAERSKHSDAWTLAGRTASVNMSAQCVTFEREGPAASRT